MIAWYGWLGLVVYILGFALTMHFNIEMAPNATPALMLLRAFLWPVYWFTGWPHGTPLTMD